MQHDTSIVLQLNVLAQTRLPDSSPAAAANVLVTIHAIDGRKFELLLPRTSTISCVKARLEREAVAPVPLLALFVAGTEDECEDGALCTQFVKVAAEPGDDVTADLFLLVRPEPWHVQTSGPAPKPRDVALVPWDDDDAIDDGGVRILKLLLVGHTHVGKTCLLRRISHDDYSVAPRLGNHTGIDVKRVKTLWHNQRLGLHVWDSSGTERCRAMTLQYCRGVHGIALVFDVTSRESFMQLPRFISQIQQLGARGSMLMNKGNNSKLSDLMVIVASKCDTESGSRAVGAAEAQQFAHRNGMDFFEVSAKDGIGCNECISVLAKKVIDADARDPAGLQADEAHQFSLNMAAAGTRHSADIIAAAPGYGF